MFHRLTALIGLFCWVTSLPAWGLSLKTTGAVTLNFAAQSADLQEDEKQKIIESLKWIQKNDWCPIERIIVYGYAAPTEGNDQTIMQIAAERVETVLHVLHAAGIPRRTTVGETQGSHNLEDLTASPRVEIEFIGLHQQDRCPVMKNAAGFRAR